VGIQKFRLGSRINFARWVAAIGVAVPVFVFG